MQGMLFGATTTDDEADNGPVDEVRLCALNVNSPNPARAQRIDCLLGTKTNTQVLTEMQPSDGGPPHLGLFGSRRPHRHLHARLDQQPLPRQAVRLA